MKNFILHNNEYDGFKSPPKPKTQKWINSNSPNQSSVLFQKFHQKNEHKVLTGVAEKRLRLAGLSSRDLDEKYKGVNDSFLNLIDFESVTLWSNQILCDCLNDGKSLVGENVAKKFMSSEKATRATQQDRSFLMKIGQVFGDIFDIAPKSRNTEINGAGMCIKVRYVCSINSL